MERLGGGGVAGAGRFRSVGVGFDYDYDHAYDYEMRRPSSYWMKKSGSFPAAVQGRCAPKPYWGLKVGGEGVGRGL